MTENKTKKEFLFLFLFSAVYINIRIKGTVPIWKMFGIIFLEKIQNERM